MALVLYYDGSSRWLPDVSAGAIEGALGGRPIPAGPFEMWLAPNGQRLRIGIVRLGLEESENLEPNVYAARAYQALGGVPYLAENYGARGPVVVYRAPMRVVGHGIVEEFLGFGFETRRQIEDMCCNGWRAMHA